MRRLLLPALTILGAVGLLAASPALADAAMPAVTFAAPTEAVVPSPGAPGLDRERRLQP